MALTAETRAHFDEHGYAVLRGDLAAPAAAGPECRAYRIFFFL